MTRRTIMAAFALAGFTAGCGPSNEGTDCSVATPTCTVVATPSSSPTNRLPSGTAVTLVASCSNPVTQADWFSSGQVIGSSQVATIYPTAPSGYSADMSVGFAYSNCSGGGTDGVDIFVTSAPAGGGGGGGSAPRSDGVNATSCISITAPQTFHNNCNQTIYVSACALNSGSSIDLCNPASIGYGLYDWGSIMFSIRPGGTSSGGFFGPVSGGFVYFACATGPSGIQPSAFLTSVDPPTGVCR